MSKEALIKKLDKISRDNRIFTDNLLRLMRSVILSTFPFDNTWYDCQLPSYAGGYKRNAESSIRVSAKSFAEIKTAKDFFTTKELDALSEWMKEKKVKYQVRIREDFGELFNDSTTSAFN